MLLTHCSVAPPFARSAAPSLRRTRAAAYHSTELRVHVDSIATCSTRAAAQHSAVLLVHVNAVVVCCTPLYCRHSSLSHTIAPLRTPSTAPHCYFVAALQYVEIWCARMSFAAVHLCLSCCRARESGAQSCAKILCTVVRAILLCYVVHLVVPAGTINTGRLTDPWCLLPLCWQCCLWN